MAKKLVRKKGRHFTREEQHQIIQEMLDTGSTKREIWAKYTGEIEEHGQLLRWMKKLGYPTKEKPLSVTFERKRIFMPRKRKSKEESIAAEESFETLQLKKRIKELERQLKDAELKAIAFSTMVDIAEKEFKIPIRKKLNTQP
ncbi:hypothetical protein BH11BAC2_BH11BAC2_25260 [soil metagenome]